MNERQIRLILTLSAMALATRFGFWTARSADAGTLVSPIRYEDSEAPDRSGANWGSSARAMTIIPSSEFDDVPVGGMFLHEINLRPDGDTSVGAQLGFEDYTLLLSVTSVQPEHISRTFDENVVEDPVIVFQDEWLVTASNPKPPGGATRPFDYRARFQTPFFYDPAQGNLLVDWLFDGTITVEGAFDLDLGGGTDGNQATIFANDVEDSRGGDPFSVPTQVTYSILGDFDFDDQLTDEDVDLLSAMIRNNNHDLIFDLNMDGKTDRNDHARWVHDIKQTWFGDQNLDGEFNSGDLVGVFEAGHYEDGIPANSGWSDGDWNGDGEFDTSDLVAAFSDGGYELGPRPAMNAIPEPSGLVMMMTALALLTVSSTRRARFPGFGAARAQSACVAR